MEWLGLVFLGLVAELVVIILLGRAATHRYEAADRADGRGASTRRPEAPDGDSSTAPARSRGVAGSPPGDEATARAPA